MERYNRTLEVRLRQFAFEYQADWDHCVQPLTYAYNKQVNSSNGTRPCSLVFTRHPPSSNAEANNDQIIYIVEGTSTKSIRDSILKRISKMFNSTNRRFYHAQRTYMKAYDWLVRRPKRFNAGYYVFVDVSLTKATTA